jgi:hypothetical protein
VAGLSSWESLEFACFQCGGPIAEVLAWIGSVRCHDCRDEQSVAPFLARAAPKHPPITQRSGRDAEDSRLPASSRGARLRASLPRPRTAFGGQCWLLSSAVGTSQGPTGRR